MPSPFPGMDPYLEGEEWESFHVQFVVEISRSLTPRVRPRYVVRAERRVYLDHAPGEEGERLRPDVALLEPMERRPRKARSQPFAQATSPVILTVPVPEERRESFLTIRLRRTMEIVTVIELLSPANKRAGSDGRREYLGKRETVLRSGTHLVEIDLLRGGERLPVRESLPRGDFYAFVCRGDRRPKAEVYTWRLRERMPRIPVPLAGEDPDAPLDLRQVFDVVYDSAGYDYSLDRASPLVPPLRGPDAAWARRVLR